MIEARGLARRFKTKHGVVDASGRAIARPDSVHAATVGEGSWAP